MKKITTTVAATLLFFGMSTLGAAEMKCGAGKCGASMQTKKQEKKVDMKCGGKMKAQKDKIKEKKNLMKCGEGKCGSH